jgi:hypothetical protein
VKTSTVVFIIVTSYGPVGGYRRFGGTHCLFSSNLCRVAGYHHWEFSWFSSFSTRMPESYIQLVHDRLFTDPNQHNR